MSGVHKIEWVRGDVAEATTKALRELKSNADASARERVATVGSPTVYLLVERCADGGLRGTVVSGLPDGQVVEVFGCDVAECLFEARHAVLNVYYRLRLPGDTVRDIRARLHNTTFEVIDETAAAAPTRREV